jgi:hypothetical protein
MLTQESFVHLTAFRMYNSSPVFKDHFTKSSFTGVGAGNSRPLRSSCILFYADVKFYSLQNEIENTNWCFKLGRCEDFFFFSGVGGSCLFVLNYVSFILF